MIRFGLLGCGRIAKRHSDLLGGGHIDRASLVAVCDPIHAPRVVPGLNGVFQPILVNGAGVVEGLWKASRAKGAASVALDGFDRSIDPSGYEPALARWARFHGERLGTITAAT